MKTLLFLWKHRKLAERLITLALDIQKATKDGRIDQKERNDLQRQFWAIVKRYQGG
tara:strand:- start:625 stop:792 length:168 start_codon:yes stop_codon:yes gene_type:complete